MLMNMTAVDSKTAGVRNEKLVIRLLRKEGALSQTQICSKTGLGSSTISYIVGRLREKGLIVERPGISNKRGVKPVLIEIHPAGQFIIGVEIAPSYILTGLFDFNNELIDHNQISLNFGDSVENVIFLLEANIKELVSKNNVSVDKLSGIGITISGSISSDGIVLLSSSLGWKNVPLKKLLSRHFTCPVEVFTTKVRLWAEINVHPPLTSRNIVYLNVANGVGTTTLIDGHLIQGSTNRCGELGHIVIDPNGPLCGCGQRGCLEAHISGPALVQKMKNDTANGAQTMITGALMGQRSPEDIAEKWKQAILENDQYAIELRDYVADKLSRAAAIAINLYDPDTLILAGYINHVCPEYFAESIRQRFKTDVYDQSSRSIEIIFTRAGQQALIRGAAAAVFKNQSLFERA